MTNSENRSGVGLVSPQAKRSGFPIQEFLDPIDTRLTVLATIYNGPLRTVPRHFQAGKDAGCLQTEFESI